MTTAHLRFNWIHPFPDGNDRVSRLISHTMSLKAAIGAHGPWSVSRCFARELEADEAGRIEYKNTWLLRMRRAKEIETFEEACPKSN